MAAKKKFIYIITGLILGFSLAAFFIFLDINELQLPLTGHSVVTVILSQRLHQVGIVILPALFAGISYLLYVNKKRSVELKYLITSAPGYFYKLEVKDKYIIKYISPTISILGYEAGELINQTEFWNHNIHPEDWPEVDENQKKIIAKEKFIDSLIYRIKKKNGEYIWMRDQFSVHFDKKGNPFEIVGFLTDIHEEILIKEQYDNLYRAVTHSAIVSVTDLKGKIIFANDMFSQISGYTNQEIIGEDHRLLNSGFHTKDFFKNMWETIQRGQVWEGIIRNRRKNGSYYWVKTLIEPNKNRAGKVTGYTSVRFDITEERETQKKLIHATKIATIGDLAAGVGHEINNPLMIAMGESDKIHKILKQKYQKAADELVEEFEIIRDSYSRIASITTGLRIYSRSEDGEMSVFDVNKEIQGVVRLVRNSYKISGVSIDTQLSDETLQISGNAGKFQQVLMNLVANAKDALENSEKKQIHISTAKHNENAVISILDTGSGITNELKTKIFEAYFTTKPANKGTGIGLSLSRSIVAEMRGMIRFDSQVGQGTTFVLEFPLVAEARMRLANSVQADSQQNQMQGNALIVDDEKGIRRLLREELEDIGLTVDDAEDGIEALKKVKNKKYDYIFTDVQMPNMNGLEFIRQAVELENGKTNIFVTTGGLSHRISEEEKAWLESVISGFIHKPFNSEKILKILSEFKQKKS